MGYVTYSLKEDAERAVSELDGGEFGGEGRKIRVVWADKRVCQTRELARIQLMVVARTGGEGRA